MKMAEETKLAGCCGIYCGLCTRYQSTAPSRCPGCKTLSLEISCKLYNCCVKKNGLTTCADCDDFACDKYAGFFDADSFVSHKVCLPNIAKAHDAFMVLGSDLRSNADLDLDARIEQFLTDLTAIYQEEEASE